MINDAQVSGPGPGRASQAMTQEVGPLAGPWVVTKKMLQWVKGFKLSKNTHPKNFWNNFKLLPWSENKNCGLLNLYCKKLCFYHVITNCKHEIQKHYVQVEIHVFSPFFPPNLLVELNFFPSVSELKAVLTIYNGNHTSSRMGRYQIDCLLAPIVVLCWLSWSSQQLFWVSCMV